MSGEHGKASANLYDAVGQIWLQAYGDHVHIGLYSDEAATKAKPAERQPWGDAQARMIDALLGLSGLTSAKKLLDIGCGHGATACHMAQALGCDAAVGVNISAFQVERANALAAARGLADRARFVVADGMAPPFEDGAFDVVVSVESAAYMPDKTEFVRQLSRLAAPGGTVILADFCRAPGHLTKAQLRTLDGIDGAFASAGNWHSADDYKGLFEAAGLELAAEADWTGRLRGFWDLGVVEMLLRREADAEAAFRARGALANAAVLSRKLISLSNLAAGAALLRGDFGPMKLSLGGLLGGNRRVMHAAFGSGALQYRVLVARKPAAPAAPAAAAPAAVAAFAAAGDVAAPAAVAADAAASAKASAPAGVEIVAAAAAPAAVAVAAS